MLQDQEIKPEMEISFVYSEYCEIYLKIFPWLNFFPPKSPSHAKYSSTNFFVSSLSGSNFLQLYDS